MGGQRGGQQHSLSRKELSGEAVFYYLSTYLPIYPYTLPTQIKVVFNP